MPRVGYFNGIAFYLYAREHGLVHVHCIYAEYTLVLGLDPVSYLDGYLPTRQYRQAFAYVISNQAYLIEQAKIIVDSQKRK